MWIDRVVDDGATALDEEPAGSPSVSHRTVVMLAVVAAALAVAVVLMSLRQHYGSSEHAPAVPKFHSSAGVVDTFVRPDSRTGLGVADTGQRWTALAGTWGRGGHLAYIARPSLPGPSLAVIDMAASDGLVQATQVTPGAQAGLVFRSDDAANYWWVESVPARDTWLIEKKVGGKSTVIGDIGPAPTGAGTTVTVRLHGPNIDVFVDGVRRRSVVDPDLEHASRVGFAGRGVGAMATRWAALIASPQQAA